ncbi:MAG: FecR domain-containing protein [Pseudomonadota bacterium]
MRFLGLIAALIFCAPALSAEQWIYKVQPGDNLWNFSKQNLSSMRFMPRLQQLNQVADPTRLQPGSRLKVPMNWLRVKPVPVVAKSVNGAVTATNLLGDAIEMAAGTKLLIGSRIRTGDDGNVLLLFADQTELALRANSELALDAMTAYGNSGMVDSRMRLDMGRIGATVTDAKGPGSQFEITTPAAVAAVRGTVERVATDGTSMRAEVTEGEVLVSGSGGTTRVPEGFATRAEQGKPPEPPRPLLPAPDFSAFSGLVERLPPRVSWPAVAGAQNYRIQVARDASFDTLLYEAISPTAALRGLELADGDYVLRVRAIDPDGVEGFDAVQPFTLNARPEPPFARAPAFDSTVRDQFAALTWAEPSNAVGYRVQLATDEAFANVLLTEEITSSTYTPGVPVEFRQYYWRVATKIADGEVGPYGDPQPFKLKPSPPKPEPEPPELAEKEMNFRWSKGEPGQTYHFQFARDAKFEELVSDETLDKPTITIERPSSGDYYLRIATIDTDGYHGPFSTAQKIEVPYDGIMHYLLPAAFLLLSL